MTGDVTSECACSECGAAFVPRNTQQRTCGQRTCQKRRWLRMLATRLGRSAPAEKVCPHCGVTFAPSSSRQIICRADPCKRRADYLRHKNNPLWVAKQRENNRRWAAEHRGCKGVSPWLKSAPPYASHLPGGGFELRISPPPRHPLTHENIRYLHAMVTRAIDSGHDSTEPRFALVPWPSGCGWGAYLYRDVDVAAVDGKTFDVTLFDKPVQLRFSPVRRLRAPVVTKRGHRKLVVETVTPVVVRSDGGYVRRAHATTSTILHAVGHQWRQRFGIPKEALPDEHVRIEVLEESTHAEHVQMSGKFGTVSGWGGRVVVDCNALGEWLLRVAAMVGLGGRSGLGFGRIRVRDFDPAVDAEPKVTKPIPGAWFITPHAVDRYREHTGRPEMAYEAALAELVEESRGAHHVKRLQSLKELWRGPKPRRLRFIVGDGEDGKPALVMVLPETDDRYVKESV